jgi:hypothetical protein
MSMKFKENDRIILENDAVYDILTVPAGTKGTIILIQPASPYNIYGIEWDGLDLRTSIYLNQNKIRRI